jgi:hypothetical protein
MKVYVPDGCPTTFLYQTPVPCIYITNIFKLVLCLPEFNILLFKGDVSQEIYC